MKGRELFSGAVHFHQVYLICGGKSDWIGLIFNERKGMVGSLIMDHNSASLTEVARYFVRNVTSISTGVRQLRERSNEDKHFRQHITRFGERLMQIKTSKACPPCLAEAPGIEMKSHKSRNVPRYVPQ